MSECRICNEGWGVNLRGVMDQLATKEAQLKIAIEALEIYMLLGKAPDEARKALEEIEKMGRD